MEKLKIIKEILLLKISQPHQFRKISNIV